MRPPPGVLEGNRDFQRRLAWCLVSSLGADEALELCRVNEWDGVMRAVVAIERQACGEG